MPEDFCDEAAVLVDEFIRKTGNLDYEMLMYFDYSSGEILRMGEGDKCNVEVKFNESEFIEKHVASIHNHPIDVYSPPSGKNFGIVKRDFEDYELIAGCNGLWILEAKINDSKLADELRMVASNLFEFTFHFCNKKFFDKEERDDEIDKRYGESLSDYINRKNIKNLKLIKRSI